MGRVTVNETYLSDIADAIRNKLVVENTYKPSEMAEAIESISGGITPTGTIEITQNGVVDVSNYASADVDVPNSYSASDEGKVVSNGSLVAQTSDTVTQNDTYDTTLINSLTVNVGGSGMRWELIGSKTYEKEEYTDTTTAETTDTGINVKNTDYAFIMTVITCDSAITTSNEWGMTIAFGGRYTSNSNYVNHTNAGQKSSSTLSLTAMTANSVTWSSYGVNVNSNASTIVFARKCHATGCPKIRGGLYTVSVYGLAGI